MHNINLKIRELRLSHRLTLAQMAELICVSPGNISDWESSKKNSTPSAKALVAIANQFKVSLDWLMNDSDSDTLPTPSPYIRKIELLADQLNEQDLLLIHSLAAHLAGKNKANSTPAADVYGLPSTDGKSILRESSLAAEYFVRLPLVGKITAGVPILAVENVEEYVSVPNHLVGSGHYFILRVQGESMIEKGILSGDLVIIRQQRTAENGEVVVALVNDDEATLKTFFKEKDMIRLQPANPAYEPIYSRKVDVLGKVTGVLRSAEKTTTDTEGSATKKE
ncbi:SOS regulatory protein LexA [Paenibacillus cellulosilyticus]|uniref:SOS regulatory protein LexA n=1 Tax=Paenibacillus cellulosilyticus TaxID=375489 RepID=A0A2V2YY26_9BACL|nr:transcriptional repressor LexA [Paenibacillus cellulosilyticus]PWW03233.1 SOS regulatory protein LexA [Paenibacillus cellulosilyticus]QKS43722.1 repressor LexA [Paenibacillus cellulosilyticus]